MSADGAPQVAAGERHGADGDPGARRRARRVFLAVVGVYAAGVVLLAAFGLFGFIWKAVVAPSLFIVAALLGRFRVFVRDWAVFLGAILLFDSLRGFIFALINRLELPVYMVYAIDWERALVGGETLPGKFQRAFLTAGEIGLGIKLLVVVHASHFLFFLFFGLLIWLVRAEAFGRFKLALTLLMYSGLVVYLAVPTIPPWMAAAVFETMPAIRHVTHEVYNLNFPKLLATFDSNPIAAMPSLHSAFPTLLAIIAVHHFKWRGWPMAVYTGLVFLAIVALGEHYLVDVLAGVVLAAACYWAAYHSGLPRWLPAKSPPIRTQLLLAALLLLLAEAAGLWSRNYHWSYQPTMAFVERELEGRSRLADFFRGRRAFVEGDHQAAQAAMTAAVDEVSLPASLRTAHQILGISAFHNGDWLTAADHLGRFPLQVLGPRATVMLAQARLEAGLREDGFKTLDEAARVFASEPGVTYWKTQLETEHARRPAGESAPGVEVPAESPPAADPPVP